MLADFDIFATHSDYGEISKSVLEALLTGLPVVLNKRKGSPVPEFKEDFIMLVDNSIEGYCDAIKALFDKHEYRENLGKKAYAHAQKNWAPRTTEKKFVDLYKRVVPTLD
jgi:glycosyltransferase involved in cell wall biosynthesis